MFSRHLIYLQYTSAGKSGTGVLGFLFINAPLQAQSTAATGFSFLRYPHTMFRSYHRTHNRLNLIRSKHMLVLLYPCCVTLSCHIRKPHPKASMEMHLPCTWLHMPQSPRLIKSTIDNITTSDHHLRWDADADADPSPHFQKPMLVLMHASRGKRCARTH